MNQWNLTPEFRKALIKGTFASSIEEKDPTDYRLLDVVLIVEISASHFKVEIRKKDISIATLETDYNDGDTVTAFCDGLDFHFQLLGAK